MGFLSQELFNPTLSRGLPRRDTMDDKSGHHSSKSLFWVRVELGQVRVPQLNAISINIVWFASLT